MLKTHENKVLKGLREVAKVSLLLTGVIFAVLGMIIIIGVIFSIPPLKATLLIFLSVWAVLFLITYLIYKWQNRKLRTK